MACNLQFSPMVSESGDGLMNSLSRLIGGYQQAQCIDELMQITLQEIRTYLGFERVWVYRYRSESHDYELITAHGDMSQLQIEIMQELRSDNDLLLEEIFASSETVYVEDCRTDTRVNRQIVDAYGNRTLLNCQMRVGDQQLGVVGTGSFGEEGVMPQDEQVRDYYSALAKLLAVALDRVNHWVVASVDTLTGISSRYHLLEQGEQLLKRAQRYRYCFAVLYFDLDGFKGINDAYGHHIGDKLLVHFSLCVSSALRGSDLLGRMAGDEFVALLPYVTDERVVALIEGRLRQCMTKTLSLSGIELQCRASIGYALYPRDGRTLSELLMVADQRMYQDKLHFGRG